MNTIVLTNSNAATEKNSQLSLRLTSPMKLEDSLICLSDLTMYYSWPNIATQYGNNEFSYLTNDVADSYDYKVTIPDGSYEIKDVNHFLHFVMKNNGHMPDNNGIYGINIYANRIHNRVTISVNNKYTLKLAHEDFQC